MLTTITVGSLDDTVAADGVVTLREAIQAANTNTAVNEAAAGESGAVDRILFAESILTSGTTTITLTGGQFEITEGDLVIDGGESDGNFITIDANDLSRIFSITNGTGNVALQDLTLTNGLVNDDDGGAINKTGDGRLILQDLTVTDSDAEDGGAVAVSGGRLIAIGGSYTGNTANGDDAGTIGGLGGAFAITGGLSSDTSNNRHLLQSITVDNNTATGAGGGIHINDVPVQIRDVTVSNNNAGTDTEALPGNGGGIDILGDADDTDLAAVVNIIASTIESNTAQNNGGGLYIGTEATVRIYGNSSITGNAANGTDAALDGGGGIFNEGSLLEINNATITGNMATGTNGSGGGLFTDVGIARIANATIAGNTADRAGGGIEVAGGTVFVNGTTIGGSDTADANAAGDDTSANPGNGGGLHVTEDLDNLIRVVLTDVTVQGNTAANEGGGLWNAANERLVFRGGTITGNTADNGGGLYNDGNGTALVLDSTVSNNNAAVDGGGIFNEENGTLIVRGPVGAVGSTNDRTTVDGNNANGNGGGIYNDGTAFLFKTDLTNNESDVDDSGAGSGGAVFTDANGTTTLFNKTFNGNTGVTGSTDNSSGTGTIIDLDGSGSGSTDGTLTGATFPNGFLDFDNAQFTALPEQAGVAVRVIDQGPAGATIPIEASTVDLRIQGLQSADGVQFLNDFSAGTTTSITLSSLFDADDLDDLPELREGATFQVTMTAAAVAAIGVAPFDTFPAGEDVLLNIELVSVS